MVLTSKNTWFWRFCQKVQNRPNLKKGQKWHFGGAQDGPQLCQNEIPSHTRRDNVVISSCVRFQRFWSFLRRALGPTKSRFSRFKVLVHKFWPKFDPPQMDTFCGCEGTQTCQIVLLTPDYPKTGLKPLFEIFRNFHFLWVRTHAPEPKIKGFLGKLKKSIFSKFVRLAFWRVF